MPRNILEHQTKVQITNVDEFNFNDRSYSPSKDDVGRFGKVLDRIEIDHGDDFSVIFYLLLMEDSVEFKELKTVTEFEIVKCDDSPRIDLKQILMRLGNKLVLEHSFVPAASMDPKKEDWFPNTYPIAKFVGWLNHTPKACEELRKLGVDWPVVSSGNDNE